MRRLRVDVSWRPWEGGQRSAMACPAWEMLMWGNRGGGKAIPTYYQVLTSKGYTTMKDIRVGDLVYGRDGFTYPVVGVFPQKEKKRIYEVLLQDGRTAECCIDHLWEVRTRDKKERTLSTKDMVNSGLFYPHKKGNQYKFKIPNCSSVRFSEKELPIDPYILGCLLGNGTLTTLTPKIATDDEFILEYFRKHLPEFIISYDPSTNNNYTIVSNNGKDKHVSGSYVRNTLTYQIQKLGLNKKCKEKFIPEIYKSSSVRQRMELVRGLMDTDGSINKKGAAEFTNTCEQLIDDLAFVLRSLGIRCRKDIDKREGESHCIKGHECERGLFYRLYINTSSYIVKTPDKLQRLMHKTYSDQEDFVSIVDIVKTDRFVDMQCIAVDSPDHTYLIKDFVVTHNTDTLLMDFAKGVGRGYGADYRGLLLREATTELKDVIAKSKKWFPRMFPGAKFNEAKSIWTFPDGETLWFNYARVIADYDQYHGHEYAWIGWEELTNHPVPDVYLKLMACNRSSNANIKPKYRATCNPSGPGHSWVKLRFIDTVMEGRIYIDENGMTRAHVFVDLDDNKTLLAADPNYKNKLLSMTEGDEMLRKAWVYASWDLVTGGFFADVWRPKTHIINPFIIPYTWKVQRSFDWGSSKPWAVSYGAICNGDQPENYPITFPKGSIIIVDEIYGWDGRPNKGDYATSATIAGRVRLKDKELEKYHTSYDPFTHNSARISVKSGPADNSIWDVKDGTSIGLNMSKHKLYWQRSYKGPGSRKSGWAIIRTMLEAAGAKNPEQPHLYFFPSAMHHIRTLPLLQRDAKNLDDVDSDGEDHCGDSLRYLINKKNSGMSRRAVKS